MIRENLYYVYVVVCFANGAFRQTLPTLKKRQLIVLQSCNCYYMSLVMRKPDFCICENKDADQLRGNREADQRHCFRYTDSTISLLPKYEITSL